LFLIYILTKFKKPAIAAPVKNAGQYWPTSPVPARSRSGKTRIRSAQICIKKTRRSGFLFKAGNPDQRSK
jgi:hypothetical protein